MAPGWLSVLLSGSRKEKVGNCSVGLTFPFRAVGRLDREEPIMKSQFSAVQLAAVIVSMSLVWPVVASAQSKESDATYCTALSHDYQKYVSSAEDRHPQGTPADINAAMAKCQSGDTASAIPVLENALRNQKINLPPRG
jgi:hypothetical protein